MDDLFAVKRAERPSPEFWDDFQRECHVRQRAAAIEPKRWWFVLPRLMVGLSRYQMPMGAAAVFAVTFLSFREYREPGLEFAYTPSAAAIHAGSRVVSMELNLVSEVVAQVEAEPIESVPALSADQLENLELENTLVDPVSISPLVVWAGVAAAPMQALKHDSPSARSIAANLAVIEAEQPSLIRLLSQPQLQLTSSAPTAEPLSEVSSPNTTRDRLFAYNGAASDYAADGSADDGRDIHHANCQPFE
ncbi:MAG: hypothetical protein J6386_08885 [Candidatus Synoicihabitans palmerolidicus]|nr:hypothetical protein [Candidatus Synoicihabitans palmerolidicus]